MAQQEGDEQSANPPVAVGERMDRFELSVGQRTRNEGMRPVGIVEKPLQVAEGSDHLVRWWWDEGGIAKKLSIATTDPVLSGPKLSW